MRMACSLWLVTIELARVFGTYSLFVFAQTGQVSAMALPGSVKHISTRKASSVLRCSDYKKDDNYVVY